MDLVVLVGGGDDVDNAFRELHDPHIWGIPEGGKAYMREEFLKS
jgi:hypothetical protein